MHNTPTVMKVEEEREQRLERWIAQYSAGILRLCFAILADATMAQDATQDTFIKAWRGVARFKGAGPESEKAWLLRIAINTCKDYQRSAWFRHVDMRKVIEDMPETASEVSDDSRAIFLDVMALPVKYKQTVLLYHFQNLNQTETAQALGISRAAVAKRLNAAYRLLRCNMEGGDTHDA